MTPLAWVAFAAAAGVAATLRYLVDGLIQDRSAGLYPWGTFAVNASGSLLFGVLTGMGLYHGLADAARVVLGTGLCGAYTTFSTFTFETVRLLEEGAVNQALGYAAGTLVTCGVAAAAGIVLAGLAA